MTSTDKKYEMFEARFPNPEQGFILHLRRLYPNFTQDLANEVYKQHGKEGYEEQKSCDAGDMKEEQAVATNVELHAERRHDYSEIENKKFFFFLTTRMTFYEMCQKHTAYKFPTHYSARNGASGVSSRSGGAAASTGHYPRSVHYNNNTGAGKKDDYDDWDDDLLNRDRKRSHNASNVGCAMEDETCETHNTSIICI